MFRKCLHKLKDYLEHMAFEFFDNFNLLLRQRCKRLKTLLNDPTAVHLERQIQHVSLFLVVFNGVSLLSITR